MQECGVKHVCSRRHASAKNITGDFATKAKYFATVIRGGELCWGRQDKGGDICAEERSGRRGTSMVGGYTSEGVTHQAGRAKRLVEPEPWSAPKPSAKAAKQKKLQREC